MGILWGSLLWGSQDQDFTLGRYLTTGSAACLLWMTIGFYSNSAYAMDLQTAVEIALQSNPEIAEAAANRRAIDFEYEQARRLNNPSLILEGRAGPEWVDSRTTRLLGNDDDVLFGRQASATFQQNLLSFGRNGAERDRQASRVDSAAYRVRERSELVSLDVVQAYLDIMRLREIVDLADQNVAFHEGKVSEISRGVSGGIKSEADAQQARERLSAAKISRSETEEALDIAGSDFRRVVGRDVGQTQMPNTISAKVPRTLAEAIGQARKNNPTLRIANTDLDTARAEYRKAKADLKPELLFEVVGRAGDDIGGFRDNANDVRGQMRLRYEFRGGIKSSVVQEQINRVDESRARIMTLERNVESLVREAWSTRKRTSRRVEDLKAQVAEGTNLLDSYSREFDIGRRTLLDILDAESSLFQAQTSLATAQFADIFAQYRLLAATGSLLDAFGVKAPREADASLRALEKVEPTPLADTEERRYPKHFDDTMGNYYGASQVATIINDEKSIDFAKMDIRPIIRRTATPEEAKQAMNAIDAIVDTKPTSPSALVEEPTEVKQAVAKIETNIQPITEMAVELYEGHSSNSYVKEMALSAISVNPEVTQMVTDYVVVKGDTLYSIATRNNLSVEKMRQLNALSDNNIKTGQRLYVPAISHEASVQYSLETAEPYYAPSRPVTPIENHSLPAVSEAAFVPEHNVVKVDSAKYQTLLQQAGARHYPSMDAVFIDRTMYLLDS